MCGCSAADLVTKDAITFNSRLPVTNQQERAAVTLQAGLAQTGDLQTHGLHIQCVLYLGLICPFTGLICLFSDFLISNFILFKFLPPKVSEPLYCIYLHLLLLCRSS